MRTFEGIPVAEGVVIGRVFAFDQPRRHIHRRDIDPGDVKEEIERFDAAREESVEELSRLHAEAQQVIGDEAAKIFLFHLGMLQDRTLVDSVREMIERDHVRAEYAVSEVLRGFGERFASMQDSTFRTKADDLHDLRERLLSNLIGSRRRQMRQAEADSIIVAHELTPTQAVELERERVRGFVIDVGGPTSHTAIVARALQLPAVVGCKELSDQVTDGQPILIDGYRGRVILDPDEETLAGYESFIESQDALRAGLRELAGLPTVTSDGVRVELLGNIEFPDEITSVLDGGGVGVGLYRTEFLFLTSQSQPTEEDQFAAYKRCVELLEGRPLTIRTLDLGADKYTQQRAAEPERNPFLGCRSIRLSLRLLPQFRDQLRAILRASAFGPVKIMFPLVTSLSEFRRARLYVRDVMEDLEEEGVAFDPRVPIGMMVEVPSAAIMAGLFAREADFFSIGTNDLVQYTLAVDRTNEQVAHLYAPTHPAVIRLIREVVKAGRSHEIPVSCCGESAADPEYALLLIGLGVRTLSTTASAIPSLKRAIRAASVTQCERLARKAFTFDSAAEVSSFLRDRARKILPEVYGGRSAE